MKKEKIIKEIGNNYYLSYSLELKFQNIIRNYVTNELNNKLYPFRRELINITNGIETSLNELLEV